MGIAQVIVMVCILLGLDTLERNLEQKDLNDIDVVWVDLSCFYYKALAGQLDDYPIKFLAVVHPMFAVLLMANKVVNLFISLLRMLKPGAKILFVVDSERINPLKKEEMKKREENARK